MQALKTVACCASASQCPRQQQQQQQQQGPPAWLAWWLDVAIAAGAAPLLVDLAAAANGSPLHLWVGGQQLNCAAANDREVTTSAKTEQRVVCGLSVLHGAVAERGCGLACAAGWVRASRGTGGTGRARSRGPPARRWRCWRQLRRLGRPCSCLGHGGGAAAAGLPMGKGRPRGCGTCLLPAISCHHVSAAAWSDRSQPKRLHRVWHGSLSATYLPNKCWADDLVPLLLQGKRA
jgi:hypothetical protein